jgi:hypothetical protein
MTTTFPRNDFHSVPVGRQTNKQKITTIVRQKKRTPSITIGPMPVFFTNSGR